MNNLKKLMSVLLVLTLMLSVFSACGKKAAPVATEAVPAETTAATAAAVVAETEAPAQQPVSDGYYHIGDKIDDFTVTTFDGKEVNLYKVLEEKDMVLLNLFAGYCDPCASEFPFMQEAYEQYRDKVEIIAMSTDPGDDDEFLTEYTKEKGMTFPVSRDTNDLASRIHSNGIPISIVVDRFGTICMIQIGGVDDLEIFTRVFGVYTAEEYTQSVIMPSILSELPEVEPVDPAELAAALNAEGGNLTFSNSTNPFFWPMLVAEKDGRTVVYASNASAPWSRSVVETQLEVQAGDVLVMEYMLKSDYNMNILRVSVDGKDVKVSSVNQDWDTYAYQFEESGSHQVTVSLSTDQDMVNGNEGLWIDSIRVVSAEEGAEALAKNPVYPVGDEYNYEVLNENAQMYRIFREDNDSTMAFAFVHSDPVLRLKFTLDKAMAPEATFLMDGTGRVLPLASFATEDGYLLEISADDPSGFDAGEVIVFYESMLRDIYHFFSSREELDAYVTDFSYAVGGDPLKVELWDVDTMEAPDGDGSYTVTYVDQNGDPVPGVMCQVCDATSCQVFVSDESGVCQFELAAGTYEIHTLMLPDGYEGDTTTITEAPLGGGELSFTLTRK